MANKHDNEVHTIIANSINRVEDKLDKIDDKVDSITIKTDINTDKIVDINKTLEVNTASLVEHSQRSTLLKERQDEVIETIKSLRNDCDKNRSSIEIRMTELEKPGIAKEMIKKWAIGAGALVGVAVGIFKLLDYFKLM